MTATVFLVYKSQPQLGAKVVNGVTAVVVNSTSVANAKANAVAACNAAFTPVDAFDADYFDSTAVLSDYSTEGLSANGDAYVFPGPSAAPVAVSHTAYTPV